MSTNPLCTCRSMVTIAIVAAAFVPMSARAQVIVNGSFEQPTTNTAITVNGPANTTGLPGWTVGLVSIDVVNAAGNGFLTGPAFDGAQYVDLDGSPGPGEISQTLATVLGQSYSLSFAYGNNVVGAQSSNPGATVALTGSDLTPFTINHSTSTTSNLGWTVFTGTFTATGTSATLSFTSTSTGGNGGILLDAVSVTPVPEPGAFALVSMSTVGWVTFWRRRGQSITPTATLSA
jgi:choice-of-anchor C domain-containing protein